MAAESRPRRTGRIVLVLAALALAGLAAFATWWTTTLWGLPDVGDPFDVAEFTRPIPDESNAFVLYREAAALLPKEPEEDANYDWNTASPVQRGWIERSRKALEVWRKGTERADSLHLNPGLLTFVTKVDTSQALRSLGRMALVEGSRLESVGDYEGALDLYLALLRSSRHCGRRSVWIDRLIGVAMHRWASTRLIRWAADPKVDSRLLRKALDAAILAGAMTVPLSDGVKAEYLSLLHSLDNPDLMVKIRSAVVEPTPKGGAITRYPDESWKTNLLRVRRKLINEPERSRRVIRMIFANWLACCDLPASKQPPRLLSEALKTQGQALLADLYALDASAPSSARALPPETLATWYASTLDAEASMPGFWNVRNVLLRERAIQDSMLGTLANEVYRREHDRYPDKLEELVGPYLKVLPETSPPPKSVRTRPDDGIGRAPPRRR